MTVDIRKADSDDAAAIEGIAANAYARYVAAIGKKPAPMVADFITHLKEDTVFVAEVEGRVIGYAMVIIKDGEYWLENIAVDPAAAQQGVGRALIRHLEGFIAAAATHYQLYTNEKMVENIDWYRRIGFDEVKRATVDGFERVYFRKQLDR